MQVLRFNTDDEPRATRFAAFAAATTDFLIEAQGDPLNFAARATTLHLAPLVIVEFWTTPLRCLRDTDRIVLDARDHFTISLILEGTIEGVADGSPVQYGAGDAAIYDLTRTLEIRTPRPTHFITILVPRYYLEEVLPGLTVHGPIAASPAVALVRDHIRNLFERAADLAEDTARLHARSLRDMLAAAVMPLYRDDPLEKRRVATLLARATDHIDKHLGAELDAGALGTSLGVSRSSLYRATREAGGVEELILRRRLVAVHRRLADPRETRTIAAIAHGHGFPDASQFSRQFRRFFGVTATEARRRGDLKPSFTPAEGTVQQRYHDIVEELASDRGEPRPGSDRPVSGLAPGNHE